MEIRDCRVRRIGKLGEMVELVCSRWYGRIGKRFELEHLVVRIGFRELVYL